jgi:hypothetical protein
MRVNWNIVRCVGPLENAKSVNGRKTIQTMRGVQTIAYRPKFCARADCAARPVALPSGDWQRQAPKGCTYGHDVIATLGWDSGQFTEAGRQHGQLPFAALTERKFDYRPLDIHQRALSCCLAPLVPRLSIWF